MKANKRNKSKFKSIYGFSVSEMVENWGCTRQAYGDLHRRGLLGVFLEDPERFRAMRFCKNDTKYLRKYGMVGKELLALLGMNNHTTINELDRIGLLQHCIDLMKERLSYTPTAKD